MPGLPAPSTAGEGLTARKDRLHVLFLAAWYPDQTRPELGVFIREHALAVSLHCKVSVLHVQVKKAPLGTQDDLSVTRPSEFLTEFRLTINTPVRRFGFHDRLVRAGVSRVIEQVRSEGGEIDLYHIHVRDHITKLLPDLPELDSIPFLLTEHWSFYHTGINALPKREQRRHEEEIKQWFARPLLKRICPVSHDLARTLVSRFSAPPWKIHVIPNVANELFKPQASPATHPTIRLALVGIWQKPKNPLLLVEALAKLRPEEVDRFDITWIGEGPEMAAVRSLVKEKGWRNIKFLGMQPKAVVAETLRQADYLVHPTDAENLPCIIIESLASGTPVVSMRVNGIPELVDASNGVLIDAKDVDQLTTVLRSIQSGDHHFDRLEISRRAAARFSAAAIGAQYAQCYRDVLDARAGTELLNSPAVE